MIVERGDVRLSIAIQHHPARDECLEKIRADLEVELDERVYDLDEAVVDVETVVDPDPFGPPSPWRTAQVAWATAPEWCTHRMVIQDDAMPCIDFLWGAVEAIRHRPDALVSYFMSWQDYPDALAMISRSVGSSWHPLAARSWVPCVCVSLPLDASLEVARWDAKDAAAIADDLVLKQWADHRAWEGRPVGLWQTIPSLVQHDDDAISTMLGHRQGEGLRGRPRPAACWIGDHSAREVDWTLGLRGLDNAPHGGA